jgi:hypothetical protein
MSKKPMTWLELIKLKLSEEKSKGKSPSINDIMPVAKKEWAQIKEGKHPLYEQGKAQTFARKKKGEGKTKKNKGSKTSSSPSRSSSPGSSPAAASDIQEVLAEIKVCGSCKKKVAKYLKKKGMKGGTGTCGSVPKVGGCGPAGCPM